MSQNGGNVPRRKRENEPAVQIKLDQLRRVTDRAKKAQDDVEAAIRAARETGASYRELAEAAGMNHETIRRLLNH